MKLDRPEWPAAVLEGHHHAVLRLGRDFQIRREALRRGNERVIPGDLQGIRQAGKESASRMRDERRLSMNGPTRLDDFRAQDMGDRLMSEADAQDRDRWSQLGNHVEADAG